MSNTKFTPGPWVADTTDPSDVVVWAVPDPSDKLIANIGQRVQQVQVAFDCDIANAHLIAAAPDLYAALYALLKANLSCDDDNIDAADAARAALAKARGEA